MGIFGKKVTSVNTEIVVDDFPPDQRKLNVLMGVANAVCQDKPDVTLELTESLEGHPVSEIKKYEDEFKSWNLERYL
jgi:hypothetical protein